MYDILDIIDELDGPEVKQEQPRSSVPGARGRIFYAIDSQNRWTFVFNSFTMSQRTSRVPVFSLGSPAPVDFGRIGDGTISFDNLICSSRILIAEECEITLAVVPEEISNSQIIIRHFLGCQCIHTEATLLGLRGTVYPNILFTYRMVRNIDENSLLYRLYLS